MKRHYYITTFQSTCAQAGNSLGSILSFVPRLLSSNCRFSEVASSRFCVCDYFASLGSYLLTTGGEAASMAVSQEWKQK